MSTREAVRRRNDDTSPRYLSVQRNLTIRFFNNDRYYNCLFCCKVERCDKSGICSSLSGQRGENGGSVEGEKILEENSRARSAGIRGERYFAAPVKYEVPGRINF